MPKTGHGAGYFGTPLARKLGLKAGQAVAFVALPDSLAHLQDAAEFRRIELAPDWRALPEGTRDVIQFFTRSLAEMAQALPVLCDMIEGDGMIWVCWPKAGTDQTRAALCSLASANRLVDQKGCVLDEVWSGLKLVLRPEMQAHPNARTTA